jgi:Rrf2 family nitric oxide-sensitive transcriptional repressor
MRLTRFTDNSLRTLIYLSLNDGRGVTISEIAKNCDIPKNHLMKVVHSLAKSGFVMTARGRNGGVRLAKLASEIKVGNIVRVMEGRLEVIKCFEPRCPIVNVCKLRSALSEASAAFLAVLDNYSIEDLVKEDVSLRNLLKIK